MKSVRSWEGSVLLFLAAILCRSVFFPPSVIVESAESNPFAANDEAAMRRSWRAVMSPRSSRFTESSPPIPPGAPLDGKFFEDVFEDALHWQTQDVRRVPESMLDDTEPFKDKRNRGESA
jgi:hypothetical protein